MTNRLPYVGGDNGGWGQILNDFLAVEHNPDGTLKKAGDITNATNAAAAAQAKADTAYIKPGSGIPAGDLSSAAIASLAKADTSVQSVNAVFPASGNVTLTATDVSAIAASEKAANNGVASLDGTGKLTSGQIPTSLINSIELAKGRIQGNLNRSYAFVAGVIRNYDDGQGWRLIPSFHPSIGITAVDSLTDTGLIELTYDNLLGVGAGRTVTLLAQPDETLTKAGISCGCSVEPGVARIQFQQTRKLNDYVYYDVATSSYKLWKNEFWGAGRSPFTISSATNNHLILGHPQAILDDRFDFQLDRLGGPGENYQPFIATGQQSTILTQVAIDFWTDTTTVADAIRVTTPDAKCRAFVSRGMNRYFVPPADISETTYPNGNVWIIGIMQMENTD
jgi:hypothetical protein